LGFAGSMATARPIGECRKAVDQFAGSKTDRLVTHGSFPKSAQLYTQIEELAVTLIIRVKASQSQERHGERLFFRGVSLEA
jgi:hypothetical protein